MDEKTIKAIKILALKNTVKPDYEASYRHICRWFSSKFSVPLTEVENLSEEYVLQHYFEYYYKNIYDDDSKDNFLNLVRSVIKETDDTRSKEEELEDDKWAEQILNEIKAEQDKEKASELKEKNNNQEEPNIEKEPEYVVREYGDFDQEIE